MSRRRPLIAGLVLVVVSGCAVDEPLTAADRAAIRSLVDRSVDRGEIVATRSESTCIERGLEARIGGAEAWNALRIEGDPTPLGRMLYEAAGSCLSESSAGATVAASLAGTLPEQAACVGSAVVAELGAEPALVPLGGRRFGGPFDRVIDRALAACTSSE